MRTIVHLSDLHFGHIDQALLGPLEALVHDLAPQLVVVSGDLTQRARSAEFREARQFLDRLPRPHVVVPGNHDVPLYNVYDRFFRALSKYRRYINDDLEPFYTDEELAVLGVNTARSFTFSSGNINERQVAGIRDRMCRVGPKVLKVLVTHHPFDLPEQSPHNELVGGAHRAMEALASCGVDVVLSGHLHLSSTSHSAKRFRINGYSALIVHAGTATSTRGRGEPNSFNVIRLDGPGLQVERIEWEPEQLAFRSASTERFERGPEGWIRLQ